MKLKKRAGSVMLAAAVSAATLALAPAAQAAETWSSCCVAGVHSQGNATEAYSYITIDGYVRDTAADGNGVYINLIFQRKNALNFWETKNTRRVGNYQGYGTNLNFSWKNYYGGGESRVLVMECLNRNNTLDTCSGYAIAWQH